MLLPFFPKTSHCPSNETTKGTGTKNNARNPPKYALYTGCFISVANWSECSRSNYGRIYKVESCRIPRYHCDPLYGKNYREREVHHRVQPRIYCYSAASLAIRGKDSMMLLFATRDAANRAHLRLYSRLSISNRRIFR